MKQSSQSRSAEQHIALPKMGLHCVLQKCTAPSDLSIYVSFLRNVLVVPGIFVVSKKCEAISDCICCL